jgi:hypothetical protein
MKACLTILAPLALLGGCGMMHAQAPSAAPIAKADDVPAVACPWVDGEHAHAPSVLQGSDPLPLSAPAAFRPGCAIIRFTVSADGRVSGAALRAAYPLDNGPVALAALQHMRFQPARNSNTTFVIRLGLRGDATGHVTVTSDTRHEMLPLWAYM